MSTESIFENIEILNDEAAKKLVTALEQAMEKCGIEMVAVSRRQLISMVKTAFDYGEEWGVTYSTWFTPSDEQKQDKIEQMIREIRNDYGF